MKSYIPIFCLLVALLTQISNNVSTTSHKTYGKDHVKPCSLEVCDIHHNDSWIAQYRYDHCGPEGFFHTIDSGTTVLQNVPCIQFDKKDSFTVSIHDNLVFDHTIRIHSEMRDKTSEFKLGPVSGLNERTWTFEQLSMLRNPAPDTLSVYLDKPYGWNCILKILII